MTVWIILFVAAGAAFWVQGIYYAGRAEAHRRQALQMLRDGFRRSIALKAAILVWEDRIRVGKLPR